MRTPRWLSILCCGLPAAVAAAAEPVVLVANPENQTVSRVHYTGPAWPAEAGGFLVGIGRGHRLLAAVLPGPGDFRVEAEFALARAGRESSFIVGRDGELVMNAGAKTWRLRGAFFNAADAPREVAAPVLAAGARAELELVRSGDSAVLRVGGAELYRGRAGTGALGALGFDPGTGTVRLHRFTVAGNVAAAAAPRAFGNTFGLQLRRKPSALADLSAPAVLRAAETNESSAVARRDGTLEVYGITKPASDSVSVIRSRDEGLTWSAPEIAFPLPGKAYYALQVLEARDGALHAVVHLAGEGPGGYRGRLYEVYHLRRPAGGAWSAARKVIPGYVGSIRGFIQLGATGRLVLAVGLAVPEREAAPKVGPDFGWNDTVVYFSDDAGGSWQRSPDRLQVELAAPNVTRYGAVEPALLELAPDRIWMLVRDRGGRLWQSFSADGARWPALARTDFISSDSPAALLKLRDGRIVLFLNACQNWTDPRSYAMGGREVLHAAISADGGRSWRGFRDILHETDVVSGGDRGTAYPSAVESRSGKIVVMSGQGEGKRALVGFDPAWLEARAYRDDLAAGPVGWTQYGAEGLAVETLPDGKRVLGLALPAAGVSGATWNFPMAGAGELRARIRVPAAVRELKISLTDHFNRIDDRRAAEHAVWSAIGAALGALGGEAWHDLRLTWADATAAGKLGVVIDGRTVATLAAQRPALHGVNHLRLEFRSAKEGGRILLADVEMQTRP
jgi:hypothetical protein